MTTALEHQDNMPVFEGRMRTQTRVLWYITIILALIIFAIGIPGFIEVLFDDSAGLWPESASRTTALILGYGMFTMSMVATLASLGMAVLLFMRAPHSRMAYLTSLFLIATAVVNTGPVIWAQSALNIPETSPWNDLQAITRVGTLWFWWVFPTGRFAPRWVRKLVLPTFLLSVLWWVYIGPLGFDPESNPLTPVRGAVELILILGTLGLQIYRYLRIYNPLERQQSRLVVIGAVLQLAIIAFAAAGYEVGSEAQRAAWTLIGPNLWFLSFTMVPFALALAVLRYRLWAVDLIIRRTLQYALITLLLGGVYFGGVVLLQTLFERITGQESPLAVVASTLAIAALFNPLRHRVQNFIDRRFDRRKYDAQRTLDEFAASVRDEVDIINLEQSLVNVVNQTMQPDAVSLWVREDRS